MSTRVFERSKGEWAELVLGPRKEEGEGISVRTDLLCTSDFTS